jgi:hypothetical protein
MGYVVTETRKMYMYLLWYKVIDTNFDQLKI